jgi:hypothetical protein
MTRQELRQLALAGGLDLVVAGLVGLGIEIVRRRNPERTVPTENRDRLKMAAEGFGMAVGAKLTVADRERTIDDIRVICGHNSLILELIDLMNSQGGRLETAAGNYMLENTVVDLLANVPWERRRSVYRELESLLATGTPAEGVEAFMNRLSAFEHDGVMQHTRLLTAKAGEIVAGVIGAVLTDARMQKIRTNSTNRRARLARKGFWGGFRI